ncbi:MAG: hypothetical protein KatS3mg090_0265 [Patescibacteria group bacterium]|nr:MAG: hypothetical protein KatS3mg090_0265 [Patescibacteria group bacterium]
MSIIQRLKSDQINALKKGQKMVLEVVRYILSKIKNKQIELQRELTDADVVQVLRKIKKELSESLEYAKKGNRQEAVEEYQQQLKILESYLPAEMSDEQLKKAIEEIIKENQQLYLKNPNAVLGMCVKKLGAQVEPSRIVQCFKQSTLA